MVSWSGFKNRVGNYQLRQGLKAVLQTPAISARPDSDFALVSQLHPGDIYAYLVAIKSVMQSFDRAAVIIVDDGLSPEDRNLISGHIPGIEFRPIQAIDRRGLQQGGTWERLITIVDECQKRYVMQVDSDILAVSKLDAVRDHIENARSFALTDKKTTGYMTFSEVSAWTEDNAPYSSHMQYAVETQLRNFPRPDQRRYIKATSAFTGFAKESTSMDQLVEFSRDAEKAVGDRWKEWGSEQVSSNYLIANTPEHGRLNWPDYINHTPQENPEIAKLVHFYGTYRHYNRRYLTLARQVISRLKSGGF